MFGTRCCRRPAAIACMTAAIIAARTAAAINGGVPATVEHASAYDELHNMSSDERFLWARNAVTEDITGRLNHAVWFISEQPGELFKYYNSGLWPQSDLDDEKGLLVLGHMIQLAMLSTKPLETEKVLKLIGHGDAERRRLLITKALAASLHRDDNGTRTLDVGKMHGLFSHLLGFIWVCAMEYGDEASIVHTLSKSVYDFAGGATGEKCSGLIIL